MSQSWANRDEPRGNHGYVSRKCRDDGQRVGQRHPCSAAVVAVLFDHLRASDQLARQLVSSQRAFACQQPLRNGPVWVYPPGAGSSDRRRCQFSECSTACMAGRYLPAIGHAGDGFENDAAKGIKRLAKSLLATDRSVCLPVHT